MEFGTRLDLNLFVGEAVYTELDPFFHIYVFGPIDTTIYVFSNIAISP